MRLFLSYYVHVINILGKRDWGALALVSTTWAVYENKKWFKWLKHKIEWK